MLVVVDTPTYSETLLLLESGVLFFWNLSCGVIGCVISRGHALSNSGIGPTRGTTAGKEEITRSSL